MSVTIAGRTVGLDHQPFVVAEMSGNHNHSLDRALAIVEAAAACGAHGLKIQTYTADTITLDIESDEFRVDDPTSPWNGRSLHSLYAEACTPWEWHEAIFTRSRELGMVAFSTPFDETAVDFLETIGAPCYKIASMENVHLPLIRKAASTGKPLMLSTGMASVAELDEAVLAAREGGASDVILLKCTSSYPASPGDSDLATIPHMRELFDCEVGLSDHTMGVGVAVAAVALGAVVVEKHLTLARADGGVDSTFSLEPHEFQSLVGEAEAAWQSIGRVRYGPTERELKSLAYRRSLYVACDMKAGDVFTAENLRAVRPGRGLAPKYLDVLLGRRVSRPVPKGTPATWDLLG